MKLLIRETIRKMSACLPSNPFFASNRRERGGRTGWLGRGFSRVEERATRFAWPRAIKRVTHTWCTRSLSFPLPVLACICSNVAACVLSCVFLRVVQVASPLARIVKVLNLVCESPCEESIITTSKDHARPSSPTVLSKIKEETGGGVWSFYCNIFIKSISR